MDFAVGNKVTAIYKTGKYIGEITDIRSNSYLVRVLAVLKHPMQGDLHNPKQVEGVFFHERKALSFREQMNTPKPMVKPYEGEIPDYRTSLLQAVDKMRSELTEDNSAFAEKSLKNLEILETEYNRVYKNA
ncbi:kinase-associated lipoprotein B [Niallia taxi]|nr:kinase-associated lipoprotein B [Niallia taxi]MDE5055088.1 kinase-associated lipoprotein B [Niallia taxi]